MNYQNFHLVVVDRFFQGMGIKPFLKKSSWMKGRSIYAKERNILKEIYISQRNIEYYNIRDSDFQSTLQIYLPRLGRKSKISDCNFFLPIMAEAALRHFRYHCIFGHFNKHPSALKKFVKLSSQQLLRQVLLLLRLILKFRM